MTSPTLGSASRLLERRRAKTTGKCRLNIDRLAEFGSPRQLCDDKNEGIADMYDMFEVLGQGSMGVVSRAVRRNDGQKVALKIVRTCDEEVIEIARAEFLLLQRIDHPHIAKAIDFFVTPDRAVLTLSFFAGVNLGSAIKRTEGKRLSEVTACKMFVALLQALEYLHEHRIVHRDVKPQNVLVSCDFTDLQLIDFNIARYLPEGGALTPNCTPMYAAPEVRWGSSPSAASDVWGAGLCLCLMLCGHCRFDDIENGSIWGSLSSVSELCKTTLRQCLAFDELVRPDATTLLQSAWVKCSPTEAVSDGDLTLRTISEESIRKLSSSSSLHKKQAYDSSSESTGGMTSNLEALTAACTSEAHTVKSVS